MMILPRSVLSGAFCALVGLTACEVPQKAPQGGEPAKLGAGTPAVARQDSQPSAAQAAFIAWADSLASSPMLPMNISVSMAMAGDISDFNSGAAVAQGQTTQNTAFAMNLQGGGDLMDWSRFRLRFDLQMEIGALKDQSGGRPIMLGCSLVGDGETIWVEPDWSKAWFAEKLHEQGVGIENMVFSVQVVTVRKLCEVLPFILPEEDRAIFQSVLDCSADPASLAQFTARTTQALSFQKRGGRVYAELESLPGLWNSMEDNQLNPLAQFMQGQPLRYLVEFDQATGVMLRTEYALALDGASLSMTYLTKLADRPYPSDFFRYQLPPGRKVFPVDVFMNPIVMELRRQAGVENDPAKDDFEF